MVLNWQIVRGKKNGSQKLNGNVKCTIYLSSGFGFSGEEKPNLLLAQKLRLLVFD